MNNFMKFIIIFNVFFIILAEKFNVEVLVMGLIVSLSISIFNKKQMEGVGKRRAFLFKKTLYFILYGGVLVKEIVIANIQVAKIVLSPKMNICPKIVSYETKLMSKIYQTILANSITLTPGTLTMDLKDNILTVHCLREEDSLGLKDSKFEQILLKIEEIDYDK
ncbi:MAG: Na+/H+ antiporter subunit E [Anaeromicrobium sp.]|uniref:Na+/H+ antiporter subunit E n=1 Tax=Anaeromicrobium sp. TaxID=1929132 RepID=UPI0025F3DEDF|nr:Na+/H+ antiporter subunit E [Anaeromicrobium sp.]MCT4596232.1 Na+/H+ antiporter subunit E [Anaeromicrobium sp.]